MFGGRARHRAVPHRAVRHRPWRLSAAAGTVLALVAGTVVAVQVTSPPPASAAATVPAPAAWWQFNEGSGTTTADSSGNGHTGTLGSGATWAAPEVGAHSIATNGTSAGNVTASGAVVNTSASYTVSAWVNLNIIGGSANQTLVGINGLASPTPTTISGFYLQYQSGPNDFAFTVPTSDADGSTITQALSSTLATAGTWYHLVGVYSLAAQTISLYVNGALQATTAITTPWQATGNTTIGQAMYYGIPVDFVNGKIDDVALYSTALTAAQVAVLNPPQISAGYSHSCEIRSGSAYCWGLNASGELGNNSTVSSSVPVPVYTGGVLSGVTLTQIAAADNYTCALSSAGTVYCWGAGNYGQLGNSANAPSAVPVAVTTSGVLSGVTVTQISGGHGGPCALGSTGAAYCWGLGTSGQLGNNTIVNSNVPVLVSGGLTLTQLDSGKIFTCGLTSSGAAYCWGDNTSGELGNNSLTQSSVPVAVYTGGVLSGVTLTQISAGAATACALSSTGAAYCWGSGGNGQLGNNSTTAAQQTAVAVYTGGVLAGVTLTQISAASFFTCALSSTGAAYCWGIGSNGDLGNNSTSQSLVAVAVSTSGVLSAVTLAQVSGGGGQFACAVDTFGAAYCWGTNTSGQAGNADTAVSFLVPVPVAPSQPTTLSAGTTHSCEIRAGKAFCWGDNSQGELGNNSTAGSSVPVAAYTGGALAGVTLTQISAGNTVTCALSSAGAAYCWGLGTSGQLGNNTIVTSGAPVAVYTGGALSGVTLTQISAGNGSVCAVSSAGAAYCWGLNSSGQLGNNSLTQSPVPVAVTTAATPLSGAVVTQVSAGNGAACAAGSTGAAYCWGLNSSGQLGNGTLTTPQKTATAVTTAGTPLSGMTVTQVSASSGGNQTCAISGAAAAYCWGLDASGQLGNGTTSTTQDTAVAVSTSGVLSGVALSQVTSGRDQGCALSGAGAAYCWGGNTDGDLGNNSTTQSTTAVAVSTAGVLSGVTLTQLTADYNFTCALAGRGAAYCWGFNGSGQGGNPATAVNFLVPVAVTSAPTLVASGYDHSCLLRNGRAFCWGNDTSGQLGNNSTTGKQTAPVAVYTSGVLSGVTLIQIVTANSFTCALGSTGAAYCWGAGGNGQLGNSTTACPCTSSDVPVLVKGGLTFTQISAGTNFACALTSAGAAYCWGANSNGQQGNGGTTASNGPGPVTTTGTPMAGVTLTQVTAGFGYACALGSGGAAYCWGLNTNGQLGNGTTTSPQLTATAVTTSGTPMAGATLIQLAVTVWSGATASTCALSSTGAAYCWGDDTYGELGNSTTTSTAQTTAVAVTVTGVLAGVTLTQITVGTNFACAVGSAGAAYCWGLGTSSQLGNNTIVSSNVPVTVWATGVLAGVTLTQISSGQLATCTEDSTGAFYCWGSNGSGQLGNGTTTSSDIPVVVNGIIPGAPTGVTATPGDTTATIAWTAPTSFGTGTLTGYTATATAASGTFTCSTTSATSCVITGLMDGTTYTVTVVTQTTDGNSPPSSPVTVEPVGNLSLISPGSLTWAATNTGSDQSAVDAVAGDQQLTATDNTETGAGWHITLSATTFTNGTHTLPNTGTALFAGSTSSAASTTAPSVTCVGTCTLPTNTTTYPVAITTAASAPSSFTIFDTAAATGENSMIIGGSTATNPIGWWIQIPASAYAGSYISTLTIGIVSAP
jgi:alpha-tubulin suppressor-like RCC1 family protein